MVPDAAVLVIGDDDQHVRPLRALFQMRDDIGDVLIAVQHVGIAGMLVEIALRLVERHLRQRAGVDRLDELAPFMPPSRRCSARAGVPGAKLAK